MIWEENLPRKASQTFSARVKQLLGVRTTCWESLCDNVTARSRTRDLVTNHYTSRYTVHYQWVVSHCSATCCMEFLSNMQTSWSVDASLSHLSTIMSAGHSFTWFTYAIASTEMYRPPVASPAMGHWGTCPLDSTSLWICDMPNLPIQVTIIVRERHRG